MPVTSTTSGGARGFVMRTPHRLRGMLGRLAACALLVFTLFGCQTFSTYEEAMKAGQSLYAQQKYDDAIAAFQAALGQDPKHYPAHLWIARAQMAKGDWSAALASARRAREIAPQGDDVVPVLADALIGAGTAAVKAGKIGDSFPLFLEAIQLQPADPSAYVAIARAYLSENRLIDALLNLVRALGLPVDNATRREALDLMLDGARRAIDAGELETVIRFLSEYVKIDPQNTRAWLDLGRSHLKSGNFDAAVAAFGGGLKNEDGAARPDLLRELFELGKEAVTSGRWRDAATALREYVEHERRNLEAFLLLSKAAWTAGDRFLALDAYRHVKELNPRYEGALKYMLGQ